MLVSAYGGSHNQSLNELRYDIFKRLFKKSQKILPEKLPPTENAAHFHILRTHFQVMKWKYLLQDDIGAEKWGWEKRSDKFFPLMTDLKSAPENLLNCISCKCKMVKKKSMFYQTLHMF